MKTFKALLITIIMLSGQLSFGNGNETCCPDTSSVQLLTAGAQAQLDQVQSESHDITATVPSLNSQVADKLQKDHAVLGQMQSESEKLDGQQLPSYSKQVALKLVDRIHSTEVTIVK